MTRESKILQKAAEWLRYYHPTCTQDMLCRAFECGAKWADEHPKSPWRDAKKELPKEYEDVLVITETNTPTCGYVENGIFVLDLNFIKGNVMYWMPIPELPKGGEE